MIDPIILPAYDLKGHRWARYSKDRHNVKIGGITYVPYQFAYDKNLREYIWKFRKGDAEAGTSVS